MIRFDSMEEVENEIVGLRQRITEKQLLIERMTEEKRQIEIESLSKIQQHQMDKNRAESRSRALERELKEEMRQKDNLQLWFNEERRQRLIEQQISNVKDQNLGLMQNIIARRTAERDDARAEVARLSRFVNERTAERDDARAEVTRLVNGRTVDRADASDDVSDDVMKCKQKRRFGATTI